MVDYAHLWDAIFYFIFFCFLPLLLWFNKSLLSWDHLLKPNELADFECEMHSRMSCCQLQPFAVNEDVLMWLLMSTEDIWHLKMCPHNQTSRKTKWNTISFGVFLCLRHTDDQCTSSTWSLTATCAVYQPWINCYKCSYLLSLTTGTLLPQQLSPLGLWGCSSHCLFVQLLRLTAVKCPFKHLNMSSLCCSCKACWKPLQNHLTGLKQH